MLILPLLLQAAPATSAPAPVPAAPPAAAPVPWAVQTRANPDGTTRAAFAAARSRDGKARLVVRCDRAAEPVVSLQLSLSTRPIGADEDHVVTLAVDGAKPIAASWQFPGNAAVLSEPESVTELTVALDQARSVTVTTTDAGTPVRATFDGPAGGSGIRSVLAACDYAFGTVPEPIKPQPK